MKAKKLTLMTLALATVSLAACNDNNQKPNTTTSNIPTAALTRTSPSAFTRKTRRPFLSKEPKSP